MIGRVLFQLIVKKDKKQNCHVLDISTDKMRTLITANRFWNPLPGTYLCYQCGFNLFRPR